MDRMDEGNNEIDESLYSRQLYVMGHEAQRRMANSNVLISCLNGVGVEVAKNIILAGVKSVSLLDIEPTSYLDLSSQFYLSEQDIGRPRAEACLQKLSDLNQYVPVSVSDGDLNSSLEFLKEYQVVVLIDSPLEQQIQVNSFCRGNGICFISGDARGVFGKVFCDFGDEFLVSDPNGEPAASFMIASVTQDTPGLVTTLEDSRHGLETGDVVEFSDVTGMSELNGQQFTVKVTSPYAFEIGDTAAYSTYERGGYVNQIKQPVTLSFKNLQQALDDPAPFLESDFAKVGRAGILHQAFRALDSFRAETGKLPTPGDLREAERVAAMAVALNEAGPFTVEGLDKESVRKLICQFALGAQGVISPMAAFLGGVMGQEVLKACSGKFSPVKQFFYFDAAEALPDNFLPPEEVTPTGSRYDSQIVVFGKSLQAKVEDLSLFLVGAGAIGCEMLKNWAMMGVATNDGACVHVTDMDRIEKSNLSRQFLFRSGDIGATKSAVSVRAATEMNPSLKTQSYELKVCGETETVFGDDFYDGLAAVCTALDNVDARLYMDQKCLFYQLPMLESGTLGTKGNTQVVVPKVTENYGATRDPPEKSFPVCTLKNFPNQIEHTLQWARDWFEGIFKQNPEDVNSYLTDSEFLNKVNAQQNTKLDTLQRVNEGLVTERPLSLDDCVVWARLRFEEIFSNNIRQLLHNFPLDQVTSTGVPFWSGAKKPPTPLLFDMEDPLHLSFIQAAANIRAKNYGINGSEDQAYFKSILPNVMVPEFTPKSGLKISTDEKEDEQKSQAPVSVADLDAKSEEIIKSLPSPSELAGFRLDPIDFDKDVDLHMHLITATSNLRARNYTIPEADMHKSRLIAGKIIPAIATTTALVTGLVCLEMYKLLQSKPIEAYKNGFVNLALPLFAFSEPQPPATTKGKLKGEDWNWSVWDKIDIAIGNVTLKEFMDYMQDELGLEVSMLSSGVSILYSFFANKKKIAERMKMTMTEVVQSVTKKEIPPSQKYLIFEVICSDLEGDEVEIPYVRFHLR
mmetsp:Transcript_13958/g.17541  ORF Transcript_13958/g.17541 Transcript_13958/m.17541 type:complete len:1022 (+) Transcript_13958:91-3156(+)